MHLAVCYFVLWRKMNEIRRRDPKEDWSKRGLELLEKTPKDT